jgi:rod shape-determining protein MreD
LIVLRATLAIVLALGCEAGLGRFAPEVHPYVDLLVLPLIWYALTGSQRSAMLVGCITGLLQDVWFTGGVLGLAGFSKTLVGWALGGLGSRFDLNVPLGRLVAGALVTVADRFLQMGLLRLLDMEPGALDPVEIGVRALVGGLLAVSVFAILDRVGGGRKQAAKQPQRRRG